jgi:nicotinamide mononucleotide transporter
MSRNPKLVTRNNYRMDQLIKWLSGNYIELLGAILGIAYIFFSIRQSILTWPVGLLTSALYVVVFFVSKLYADMGLQVYYVVISIYGWYEWVRGDSATHEQSIPVSRITTKMIGVLSVVSVFLFLLIWYILKEFTDSPVPMADALATAVSIVATWMLARKILEHWLLWIFVDAFSVGLFLYKQLYPTVVLFVIYTVMACIGYIEWKRDLKNNERRKQSNGSIATN